MPVPAAAGVGLQEQQLLLGLQHGEECWQRCFAAAPASCADGDAGEAGEGEQQGQGVLLDLAALQHNLCQACRTGGCRAWRGRISRRLGRIHLLGKSYRAGRW